MGAFQKIATDFGLHRRPFNNNDTDFFFANTGYREAYARLLEGVRQHRGLLILTGAAGTGKTLLLRKLAQEAPAQIKFVSYYSAHLDFDDLLAVICDQLGIIGHGRERMHKLKILKEHLHGYAEQGMEVALLIDEAHLLSGDTLSRLLTLSRLRIREKPLLQLVLSGAPMLEEMLAQWQPLHAPLAKAVRVRLEPLSASDVAEFIYRQLQDAGERAPETLFQAAVVERIAGYTKGIPRLINMLCERALLLAQLDGQTTLSAALIDEAAEGLMLLAAAPVATQVSSAAVATVPSANDTLEQAEVSASETLLPEVVKEPPPVAHGLDTRHGSKPQGRSHSRLEIVLLALLAGLIGGAGGAYLVYLYTTAREPASTTVVTAMPAQVRPPQETVGVEPPSVPEP